MVAGAQLSASRRPKWMHITMGVTLIVMAVTLTVGWQILGSSDSSWAHQASTLRWVVYFFGTVLFLLLIGGLVLILMLLVREVRLNERQSNFVSAVTHELKTPVASLRLYLDPQPLDFGRLVQRAIELTRTRHQLASHTFSFKGPEQLRLLGDADALETAVLNLLDNAVKYSKDEVQVEVEVSADGDGQAQLRVRDHGVGMSRSQIHFIFNRFYRIGSEVRRSHTGTGLGLFIVKSVVKGHRGTVSADSPGPDRGSTFTITLPAASPAPEEAAESA
jgi:two-component system, OmpR family, sensor histidine kinase SenX3